MRALLFLLLAPAALAQTALTEPWPLAPGNTWAYVTEDGPASIGSVQPAPFVTGVVWTALDSVDAAGERFARIRIEAAEMTECLVSREGDRFRFLNLAADAPCDAPPEAVPFDDGAPGFRLAQTSRRDLEIGGESIPGRSVSYARDTDGASGEDVLAVVADEIGVTTFAFGAGASETPSRYVAARLRRAVIGGETYGQPLETREGYWPLAVDDRWEFEVSFVGAVESIVTWTGVPNGTPDGGLDLRMDRLEGGAIVESLTCPLTVEPATRASAWRTHYRLGCAIPAGGSSGRPTELAPNLDGFFGIWVDTVTPEATVTIGGEAVTASGARGGLEQRGWLGDDGGSTSWLALEGIGVVRYSVSAGSPNGLPARMAELKYASVGGQTYGAPITTAGEPAPGAAPLAVRVGPNPVRGTVTVWVEREASGEATLEIVDALGRVVRQRPLASGVAQVDTDGLAPGVYTVRVEAGGESASSRVVVVR